MSPSWRTAVVAATAVSAAALATYVEPSGAAHAGFLHSLGDTLVGWSFVAAGLVAWCSRPLNRCGVLMIAIGFFWFVGNLRWASDCSHPLAWTLGWAFVGVYAAVLLHLLLAFPEGRLRTRVDRVLVAAAYLDVTLVPILLELLHRPSGFGCPSQAPANLNLLLVHASPGLYSQGQAVRTAVDVVFALVVAWMLFQRWHTGSAPARRLMTPVLVAGAVAALAVTLGSADEYVPAHGALVGNLLIFLRDAGLSAVPLGFLAGLLRTGAQRSVIGELVIGLGRHPTPDGVRMALADALGDPGLTVGYWVPSQREYVDESGQLLVPPDPTSSQRAATRLQRGGQPIALLVHDPALLQTPRLIEAVAAAASMSLENERLHAEVRSQLEQVRASRARIVETADAERRRLERDLHDGAQQRLVSLGLSVRLAQAQLASQATDQLAETLCDAGDQVHLALSDLRDLARGIHPAVLTQEGLVSAVEGLVERSTVPVVLHVGDLGRLPAPVEAAGYFVVSEALANVAKHGSASSAEVEINYCDVQLSVRVTDDGAGGANPAAGSGLRGLEDRVAALGGAFTVESPIGRGTKVEAVIPCAS